MIKVLYVFFRMYNLLSCRNCGLSELLESSFVRRAVASSEECAARGLDLREGAPYPTLPPYRPRPINYLQAFLPPETLVALCNLLAVSHSPFYYCRNSTNQKKEGWGHLG